MKITRQQRVDQIQEHLQAQQDSGKSVASYCRSHGLIRHTFYGWRLRYGQGVKSAEKKFMSFTPESLRSDLEVIAEILHHNGSTIRFYENADTDLILRTIRRL